MVLTRWGPDLASVGMMLVAARYGRRGLGRALMEHVIAEAGEATVTLFATDLGRPLYEKLGFQPVRRNVSFVGTFRPGRADASTGAGASRVHASGHGGRPAGDPRRRPRRLRRRPRPHPHPAARLRRPDRRARPTRARHRGYAAAWRNTPSSTVIGPLVAPDAEAAKQLVTDLAAHAHGTIRLDLDPDRPELPAWAHKHGLEPVGRTLVMARGELTNRGTPDRLFTPISVALA